MKKLILITFIFLAVIFHPVAFADELDKVTPTPSPEPVNYELPYPGVLPGSPLYTLKVIRDTISDFLISDPSRKAEFYLHQADKRLAATIVLFENGEEELGLKTMKKSLDYHEKAIDKMIEAKKAQDNVEGIFGKLKDSCTKQIEVIEMIEEENSGKENEELIENMERAKEVRNRVNAFSP